MALLSSFPSGTRSTTFATHPETPRGAGHHGFIMLMSAMGVPQVIVCASFHDVHRVRIVSSCAHRFMMRAEKNHPAT
jgi:hypothetical protein